MTGHVAQRHVLLPILFQLPNQPTLVVEFVVDTGFSGFLTLPPAAVGAMGLPWLNQMLVELADGSKTPVDIHEATILWEGVARTVRVLATGRRPLLGTALLDGHELLAQFSDGGLVTVDHL